MFGPLPPFSFPPGPPGLEGIFHRIGGLALRRFCFIAWGSFDLFLFRFVLFGTFPFFLQDGMVLVLFLCLGIFCTPCFFCCFDFLFICFRPPTNLSSRFKPFAVSPGCSQLGVLMTGGALTTAYILGFFFFGVF